jgi:predicted transcriptional regulator
MGREMNEDGKNNLKRLRESRMLSKAELARDAGISPLTIDRIERGMDCRMSTMRKILLALNIDLSERKVVFPNLM